MRALAFGAACAVCFFAGLLLGAVIERRFAMARSCTPPEPVQQRFEPGSRLKLEHVPSPLVSAWQRN